MQPQETLDFMPQNQFGNKMKAREINGRRLGTNRACQRMITCLYICSTQCSSVLKSIYKSRRQQHSKVGSETQNIAVNLDL